MPVFLHQPEAEPRIVDLADGRLVFFPAGRSGRAYHVRDRSQAESLDKQLTWVTHAANGAGMAVLGAVVWFKDMSLLLFMLPAVFAPFLAGRVLVWGLPEVVDPVVLRNLGIDPSRPAVPWILFIAAAAILAFFYMFAGDLSPNRFLQLAVGGAALLVALVHWLERERLRRERDVFRVSETPDDTPVVPR